MENVYIVGAVRSPVGKALRGALVHKRPDELCAEVIRALLQRIPNLDPALIEDTIVGCAMPEAEQGMNMARFAVLLAGLPVTVPAVTVNRFCSSGLQTIAMGAHQIMAGGADCILAGGSESMSLVPMMGNKVVVSRQIMETGHADYYLGMGLTAENVATEYKVSREDQDQFAYNSHRKAVEAQKKGLFNEEIVPVTVVRRSFDPKGAVNVTETIFKEDEGPRADTSAEALAKLPAAFRTGGSVTAGNTSQMSDGASMCLLVSESFLKKHKLEPIARFVGFAVSGVEPRVMGIGPITAIQKVLKKANLNLKDIQRVELNEAFAAQALAVMRTLDVNPEIVNPTGGAIALGHPLGATGAKLTATLLSGMKRDKQKYGMVSMCIGTGMGAAGIFENLQLR
jgi:acetyl-CoA acyltransferase